MTEPILKKEVIGNCTLYLGDCREIIPRLGAFDACITDPVWPNAPQGMFPDVVDPRQLLADAVACMDVGRIAIILRTDSDPRFLTSIPPRFKFIRHQNLEYAVTGYIGRILGGLEVLYGFGEPIKSKPGQRVIAGTAAKAQPTKEKFNHPCVRSLSHMRFAVRWWSDVDETILDPFMGTGTTLVAATAMGRKATGIEVDPEYFEIACKRVEDALRQPDLFVAPAKTLQRMGMFV